MAAATITGQRQLAKALGVSAKTINKYIHSGDWPFDRSKWSRALLPKIKAWRQQHYPPEGQRDDDDGGDDPIENIRAMPPIKRAQLSVLVERAAKLKMQRELLLGSYVKKEELDKLKEDHERRSIQQIAAVRHELVNIRMVAIKLEGKDLRAMEAVLEEYAKSICEKFSTQTQ
jgi:hypothetical protein